MKSKEFSIVLGGISVWFSKELIKKEELWYVSLQNPFISPLIMDIRDNPKGFRKKENAIKYFLKEYKKYLSTELTSIKEYKKKYITPARV